MFPKQIQYTQSQKTSDYSLSSQQFNQRPFRYENQQSVKASWQKLKPNETDNDPITKRDRTVKSITVLQEIFSCTNQKKLIKLVSSFLQSEQQLTQITEQLDKQQIVSLFFKIHQMQSPQLVQFLHLLYDSLFSLDSSVSSKIYTNQDVLKYMILSNYEQIQGQAGQLTRILEILSEMQNLNPDFQVFEEEFQIDMEEISNSFNRVQLRILFLVSSIDILRALKGSVGLFERLEQFVFSQIKNSQIPNISDMQTLIYAYILLSEQLDIANKLGYSKQAVEIIGKSSDYSIYELKRRFMNNALRLSQKYLGSQVYDQISSMNRSFSPGFNKQQINHFNQSENVSYQFLVNQLKMDYTLNNDENFQIDFKCNNLLTNPIIYQLMDKLLPQQTAKKEKVNSIFTEQSRVEKNNQPIIVKKQFSIKQLKQENMIQSQTQNQVSTPTQKNSQQMSQTQGFQSSQFKQQANNIIVKPGLDSNEFEILQNKLGRQQQELEELKQLYNNNMVQKKNELNQTNQQNQQNDQLKKKIELLETNLVQLKNENTTYKKEKDQKQSEVIELRSFIQDLQDKQLKLEKLVQQQQQQYQQQQQQFQLQLQQQQQQQQQQASPQQLPNPNPAQQYLKKQQSSQSTKTNTQLQMNIQIPTNNLDDKNRLFVRAQSQMSHSPGEEFKNEMDDTSPRIIKQNQAYLLQLLDMLDLNTSFTKTYIKLHSNNENNSWESDVSIVHNFKMEGLITDSNDGKVLMLKAYNQQNILCTESISFDLLKSLLGYVDFQDTLPTNLPNISTTHQFFKFLILPYTAVVQDENTQQYKIQLWPKPYGLLNGLNLKIDFLDLNCLVYVHHLETDQFRIIIFDPASYDCFKLDLEMDYSSIDTFFVDAKSIKDEFNYYCKSNLLKLTEKTPKFGDDDVAEALVERHFSKDKVKIVQADIKLNQSYGQENLVLKQPIEFLKFIKQIVQVFEQQLKLQQITFPNSLLGMKYFRCKTWNAGTKSQIQIVKEQLDQQQISIYLANCFESFGPNKSKLKAKGTTQINFSAIQREFAVSYDKLQIEERATILQTILYSFNLNIFEKACEQDEQQFDKNPIVQNIYDCGSYRRVIAFDNGKIAQVTIQVIGSNRRMCGIKFSVFNVDETIENGVFLPVSQSEWDTRAMEKQKIKASVQNVPFAEYLLTQILKCETIQIILFKKILNADFKSNQINSNEIKKRKTFIERVDNILTWQEVIANL
ncbi:unnamed protein product [Paramecium pentaurelia]|uniref:Uncharacterized protein n=1 Tax=Paramecium pentaurelia TaxID=43138 RepID=A0A8S1YL98_9CILI|nr:unnamed protein product [Paramecium pentaurelia]